MSTKTNAETDAKEIVEVIELFIEPIPPDTVETIREELPTLVREALIESDQEDLLARTKNLQGDLWVRRALAEPTAVTPTEALARLLAEAPEARLSLPTVRALFQQAERLAAPWTVLAGATDRLAHLLCDAHEAYEQVASEYVIAGYPTDDSIDELHRASGVLNAELATRQQGRRKLQREFKAAMAARDRKEAARTLPPAEVAASADSIPLEETSRQIGRRSR